MARDASAHSQDPNAFRDVYHTLRPHPALQPVPNLKQPHTIVQQQRNDSDYRRLLSEGVLAILLPIEDLQNPCLFSLVSEIVADLVLGSLLMSRICEGTFIYDCIARACDYARLRRGTQAWIRDRKVIPKDKLSAYGLLAQPESPQPKRLSTKRRLADAFWAVSQSVYLFYVGSQIFFALLASTRSWPRVYTDATTTAEEAQTHATARSRSPKTDRAATHKPMMAMRIWRALGTLLWIDIRMSWLSAVVQSLQQLALRGPGQIGGYDGRLDR